MTVTALGGTSIFGAGPANPGLSATGLQNGQNVSALTGLSNSFGITGSSNAGGYTLSVAGSNTNGNYIVTGTNAGQWTVTPAKITVTYTATPFSVLLGQPLPVITGSTSVNGLMNGDKLGGTASWATNVITTLVPGRYAIIGSGLTASSNYMLTSVQAPGNETAIIINSASQSLSGFVHGADGAAPWQQQTPDGNGTAIKWQVGNAECSPTEFANYYRSAGKVNTSATANACTAEARSN